jgi:hypothetical protein
LAFGENVFQHEDPLLVVVSVEQDSFGGAAAQDLFIARIVGNSVQ